MSDITMCTSIKCPQLNTCYRAQAKPDNLCQSWSDFEYTCNEESGFEDYIAFEYNK